MRPEEYHPEGQLKIDREPRRNEHLRFINGYRAVVLFGRSGVGQSNAGKELAKRLGVSDSNWYDAGQRIRGATGNTRATTIFMARPLSLDKKVDEEQVALLKQASPENPVVVVAKRGGYNAWALEQTDPEQIKIAKVLVTCERDEAANRIFHRVISEIDDKFAELREQAARGELAYEEFLKLSGELGEREIYLMDHKAEELERIKLEAQEKEKRDRLQWTELWPETAGLDIYDPATKLWIPKQRGKKIVMTEAHLYDFHFATTHRSKYHSVNYMVDKLITMGVVEVVTPTNDRDNNADEAVSTSQLIFQA